MTQSEVFVSVVAPLSNDGDVLDAFVTEVAGVLAQHYEHREIILVDDCSTDDTMKRADQLIRQHPECRLLRLSRPFGTELAISAGLETAIGDYVVVMSPDTDPANLVPEMVDRCRDGAGIVMGIREHRKGEPWYLRVGAWGFYTILNRALGLGIPPDATHFRVLSRQVVNAIVRIPDRNRFLRTLTMQVGYSTSQIRYAPVARRQRPRSKSLFDALALAMAIAVTNSVRPLHLMAGLGFVIASLSALFVAYGLTGSVIKPGVVAGWTTGTAMTALMVGALGLMGAVGLMYLARLVEERAGRPLYFVLEERTSASSDLHEHTRNVVSEPVAPR